MLTVLWLLAVLVGAVALAYVNASGRAVTAAIAVALLVAWGAHALPGWLSLILSLAFVLLAIPLNVPPLLRTPRRNAFTRAQSQNTRPISAPGGSAAGGRAC